MTTLFTLLILVGLGFYFFYNAERIFGAALDLLSLAIKKSNNKGYRNGCRN